MMMDTSTLLLIEILAIGLAGIVIVWLFLLERAARAAIVSALCILPVALLLLGVYLYLPDYHLTAATAVAASALLLTLLLFTPFGTYQNPYQPASERFDERDIMFARARYQSGDGKYERYYANRPEQEKRDKKTRTFPDLGEPGSKTWDPLNPDVCMAMFKWIDRVSDTADGPVAQEKIPVSPLDASRRLKGMARFLGAADVGTTAVGPEHVYTHIGRGTGEWGSELKPEDFPFALVFTIEMRADHLGSAPLQPALVDSGRQYVEGAKIAFVIAEYLRSLGYNARAHHDGNYRLIMPTLAVDAGLGEIGRHSLLITPRQGTRVRIGAVTTELPLEQAERLSFGVDDFCAICKKCATNCPSNSIPSGEKTAQRGTSYWKIDEESCFRTWRSYGTDCGICVNSCPYSRPSGGVHSLIRFACRQTPLSRRFFHAMDDLFYGKRPRSTWHPEWMKVTE